jgi:hypothetical protein
VVNLTVRVMEVACSNISPETGYSYWRFPWFASVPPGKYRDRTLN